MNERERLMNDLKKRKSPCFNWLNAFWENPTKTLGDLLRGQFYMGSLNLARPSDILEGLARGLPKSTGFTEALDKALLEWLKIQFEQGKPPDIPVGLFARVLTEAFFIVARQIELPTTLRWLQENKEQLYDWLRSFHQGKTRDPEGALRRILNLKGVG